jgi:hypothetical protein
MMTTGKGTHYCQYCGYDMKAKEERLCPSCDGDYCVAKKYAPLSALKKNHPRVIAANEKKKASKKKASPRTPTLGELQKLLDRHAKAIVKIEETVDLLVRSLCREGRMSANWYRARDAMIKKEKP